MVKKAPIIHSGIQKKKAFEEALPELIREKYTQEKYTQKKAIATEHTARQFAFLRFIQALKEWYVGPYNNKEK